jgi:formylglycine-generating enzyme required for sulfatase activity
MAQVKKWFVLIVIIVVVVGGIVFYMLGSKKPVVVHTTTDVEKIDLKRTVSSTETMNLNIQSSECPTGYVLVPGDERYGTASGFCVMKYEAKCATVTNLTTGLTSPTTLHQTYDNFSSTCTSGNSKQVVSVASGYPIANISQIDAKEYCSSLGSGYHLITNNEWMTIARNLDSNGANWISGIVGTEGLYVGHEGIPEAALPANIDDTEGYDESCKPCPFKQKRTFTLSNEQIIWDMSGNVWEWNSDTIKRKDMPYLTTNPYEIISMMVIDNYGTLSYDAIRPSNSNWNYIQNMGDLSLPRHVDIHDYDDDIVQAFLRGGYWRNAGLFKLNLYGVPIDRDDSIGFRCVFQK